MTLQRISLAMIVCNEGKRLAKCLENVKALVDEMVIVDTGSQDDTVNIAKHYTEKVYYFPWNDDFSAARNFAIEQTAHEWILSLDADECLDAQASDLHSLINQDAYSAFCLPLYAMKESDDCREHDRFMVLRLFQRKHRFTGTIHEYVEVNNPKTVGAVCFPAIYHTAVSPQERNSRRGRNIKLIKTAMAKNTDDPYLHYYLGIEWLGLGRYDPAISALEQALHQFSPQQAPFRSPTLRHLVQCYKNTGQLDKALCLCLEESQQYPEYCDLFFDGGVLFELKSEYEIAIKWFQEAIKLGPPPLPFFHTDGTDGYLANYHLGYCAEKLGLFKEAQHYYEAALNNDKNYYYPLFPLILLQLTQHSSADVIQALHKRGYLRVPEVAEELAELFWSVGLPNVALQCFTDTVPLQDSALALLVRCQLYSGEIAGALQSINHMRQSTLEPVTEILIDEIIALMVQEDFETAHQQLLKLWCKPENRDSFRAVFCLYKKLWQNSLFPLFNSKAALVLLELYKRCLRVHSGSFLHQQRFAALIKAIRDILTAEPDTLMLLAAELKAREQDVKHNVEYTFTTLRGLF